ncbi:DUF2752 domain-containing protein [Streptomyces sp. TR06-5]|uniref:DUF2752 domain-containing protein n=1 Tax=unclassified Streptomyces TaxID=2593676 RepID=UPI0039A1EEA7
MIRARALRTSVVPRLAAPLAAMAAVVVATAYVGVHDPHRPGHYPACPLLTFTGLFCPGCGGLRAVHDLVHGDLPAALGSNLLVPVGALAFAVLWVGWTVRVMRARPVNVPLRTVHLWFLAAPVVAFTVVRNLPFGAVLAP